MICLTFSFFSYLFWATLGLYSCKRPFSSCGEQATLCFCAWASHCGGFSCRNMRALELMGSELWSTGLADPKHTGSSWTRGWTCVPRIGRWILNHWTTREALLSFFYFLSWTHKVLSYLRAFAHAVSSAWNTASIPLPAPSLPLCLSSIVPSTGRPSQNILLEGNLLSSPQS